MLLFSRFFSLSIAIFILPVFSFGQTCNLSFEGRVLDESTGIVLPFTSIYNLNTKEGKVADSLGFFSMKNLCPGNYRFQFRHIGCEIKVLNVNLKKDTTYFVFMNHHAELLNEVVVQGKKEGNSAEVRNTISKDQVVAEGNKNLSEIISKIQGVSTLKTGSGVSKPVIQGLYGNRVTILNNGIAQAGQQWGNDHSPEIDPFVANHISVVKGASALLYSGNSLGGVVLVEPGNIPVDSTLNGDINYILQSNGLGHTLNTHIARSNHWASWRVTGTFKLLGDMKSADYYLTNTGKREVNFAVQLEKKISDKWHTNLYYSLYSTKIGILLGSVVGDSSDLAEALRRPEPFYTKDVASYNITEPRQGVQHHLLKFDAHCELSEKQSLQLKYGGQIDIRKEFDKRRGGRSDKPALSLWQNNQFIEGIYNRIFGKGYSLQTGVQFDYTDNVNAPGIGVLPLIPDYRSYHGSSLIILKRERNRLFYDFGARYDLKKMNVWYITTYPSVVEHKHHLFNNYSLSSGASYRFSNFLKAKLNLGYVLRTPEINELYSRGLHQGVSGVEYGNPNLTAEKSLKLVLSTNWNIGEKLFIQESGYFQQIGGFIYLQPQDTFLYTIRGTFPVFRYEQTDAQIIGSDLLLSYEPFNKLKIVSKIAILKGTNVKEKIPLIYMPSNNWSGSLTYYFSNYNRLQSNSITLNGEYVFKQKNYMEGQDYLPPPNGYFLLGLNAATSLTIKDSKSIKISLQSENLLNAKYRDYMNRQRYFADDLGINMMLRLSYNF